MEQVYPMQDTYEAMIYSTAHQEPEILQCNLRLLSIKLYQGKKKKVIVLLIKSLKAVL